MLHIMIKRTSILLLVMLIVSCATNTENGGSKSVNLGINECFAKLEGKASICLDSVYDDSRCPKNLECVWEGDALAAFTLTTAKSTKSFILHSNKKFQTDTVIEGITIKLLDIRPYPVADQQIDDGTYRVEITIDER